MVTTVTNTARLDGSVYARIEPDRFRDFRDPSVMPFPTYADVLVRYGGYDAVLSAHATYAELMQGHPGFDGGMVPPPLEGGTELGVRTEYGCELWLTGVSGWDTTPWEAVLTRPALTDGQWLNGVGSGGKEITLTGVMVGAKAALVQARSSVAATLASKPRTGWLSIQEQNKETRIAVAVNGEARMEYVGENSVEFELTFQAVDAGTAGGGVFREAGERSIDLGVGAQTVVNNGVVSTPPTVRLSGANTGTVVEFSNGERLELLADVAAGTTLLVDCRNHSVYVRYSGGTREAARWMVDVNAWPLLPVGESTVELSGSTSGKVTMNVTDLY